MKKRYLLSAASIIIFVFVGCGAPAGEVIQPKEEPAEIKEESPVPTYTTAPTEIPSDDCPIEVSQHPEWETLICETFDDNQDIYWWTGQDPEMGIDVGLSNGKYRIEYDCENQTGYRTGMTLALEVAEASDYVYSLTGEIKSNFRDNSWGLIVRGDYENGYSFIINNQGNYWLSNLGSETADYLGNIKLGSHSAIKWEQPNTITAVVEGENITFYVNDTAIISHEVADPNNNSISWTVWAAEGVSTVYELDDFLIREK